MTPTEAASQPNEAAVATAAYEALPSISIVVPNFNGGKTIGLTLRSLVEQAYPRLEIIVVDGGSTDNSVDVIRQYERHIAWWVSERDGGQSEAINKGFAKATGEVMNWLCSDDQLTPGALWRIANIFRGNAEIDVLAGRCQQIDLTGEGRSFLMSPDIYQDLVVRNSIAQPSCFYRRRVLTRPGPLDVAFHYAMDVELWAYFQSIGATWSVTDEVLSIFHRSATNKTTVGGERIVKELGLIYERYGGDRIPLSYWYLRFRFPMERLNRRLRNKAFEWLLFRPWRVLTTLVLSPFYGMKRVRLMDWSNWLDG